MGISYLGISVSRTGYLGFIIAFVLFIPWAYQNNKRKLGVFTLALLIGIGLASIKDGSSEEIKIKKDDSLREVMYLHSRDMIKKKPLMGYGYGAFENNYLTSRAEAVNNGAPPSSLGRVTHPHNDTLFWAVEGGVVPILAMLILVVCFIRLLRPFKFTHAMALLALVIPIALHTQTEYPLYHSALHWLVLLVLVFYVNYESETVSETMQEQLFRPTFALRSFALLIPVFTAVFMLTNLHTISKITAYERSKQPDIGLLMDVINPLVFQDKFELHLNNFRLSMAINMGKKEEIKTVIDATEDTIKTKPRSFFYLILYHAYSNNGQPEKAQQTLQTARYLSPNDKALKQVELKLHEIMMSDAMTTSVVSNH